MKKVDFEKTTKTIGLVGSILSGISAVISEVFEFRDKKNSSENSGMITSQNSQESDKTKT